MAVNRQTPTGTYATIYYCGYLYVSAQSDAVQIFSHKWDKHVS